MGQYDIMFMDVITPLHNGSGEGLGLVDNPILRERTTQFPIIQASSIKGVLRDAYGKEYNSDVVFSLFGPPPGKGEEHAGAISFGEGQILAFPVRSLKGCFVWVTSPLVLWRFYQKIGIIGKENLFPELKNLIDEIISGMDKAMICPSGRGTLLLNDENKDEKLLLEEFPIGCDDSKELGEFAKKISKKIYGIGNGNFLKNEFEKKLVLLNDDTFRYFVTNSTEVVPNMRIGENGTTVKGSLRYTEYLPSETIMYSTLIFEKSRRDEKDAKGVKKLFVDKLPEKTIQIGGDETTGKGIVKLVLVGGVESNDI